MTHCQTRVGDAYFRTPRTTIKEFINLLAVLDQNPQVNWADLVQRVEIAEEANPDLAPIDDSPSTAAGPVPHPPASIPPSPAGPDDDDDLTTLRL